MRKIEGERVKEIEINPGVDSVSQVTANAGPPPGDRPVDRLIRSYPIPMRQAARGRYAGNTGILVAALERIALNIYGDTPAQVLAGDALAQYQAAAKACPSASTMGEHTCADSSQCWEPCGSLGKAAAHAAAAPDGVGATATIPDLAALVRQLTAALSKAAPGNALAARATGYLCRTGLQGNPLRRAPQGKPGATPVPDDTDSAGTPTIM